MLRDHGIVPSTLAHLILSPRPSSYIGEDNITVKTKDWQMRSQIRLSPLTNNGGIVLCFAESELLEQLFAVGVQFTYLNIFCL